MIIIFAIVPNGYNLAFHFDLVQCKKSLIQSTLIWFILIGINGFLLVISIFMYFIIGKDYINYQEKI